MSAAPDVLHLDLPLRTRSLTNARETRWKRAKVAKDERRTTWACWLERRGRELAAGESAVVTLTRIAPNTLDEHDNLAPSFKSVVDQIADCLGLPNDRDPRVRWLYEQRMGRGRQDYRVLVRVEYFRS